MILRTTFEKEIELLTDISKRSFNTDYLVGLKENDGPPNYTSVSWHKEMWTNGNLFTYLNDKDNIVGGAILFKYNKTLYVGRIFIDPKYFRKGYGYSLMIDIENYFSDCNIIKLDTPVDNKRTNSLYQKLQYTQIGVNGDEVCYEKRKNNR